MKIIYDTYKGKEIEADKRFLCFSFDQYYPNGGMGDMQTSFDDLESAIRYVKHDSNDYHYIYDRIEGKSIDIDKIIL